MKLCAWCVAVVLGASGCAAGYEPRPAALDERDPDLRELARWQAQWEAAKRAQSGASIDAARPCEERARLSATICEAAAGICRVAERRPDLGEARQSCAEAGRACEAGRGALEGCPPAL